jgi:tetratricopeptide (TPR) repeat protein
MSSASINSTNPVVRLCTEGMEAEGQGRFDEAQRLFQLAWTSRTNDLDACIAAAYVARHQPTPRGALRWNQLALDHAGRVTEVDVRGFHASLYLNVGRCHEDLGDRAQAQSWYERAAGALVDITGDEYRKVMRHAINDAAQRVQDGVSLTGTPQRSVADSPTQA